jgi:hypothetical protein
MVLLVVCGTAAPRELGVGSSERESEYGVTSSSSSPRMKRGGSPLVYSSISTGSALGGPLNRKPLAAHCPSVISTLHCKANTDGWRGRSRQKAATPEGCELRGRWQHRNEEGSGDS